MKVAVITPYYQESVEMLSRCHDSVRRQTYPATHFMVADGFPNEEVANWDVQHITLPSAHADNGNTPRSIGGISALNLGFDGFAFLDADNWFREDHVQSLVELCEASRCDVAFSDRFVVLPDGYVLPEPDPADVSRRHVDTSCYFFTARAALLLPMWAMMEKALSPACDQAMLRIIAERRIPHGWTGRPTVFFESHYRVHFQRAGRDVPPDAREVDWTRIRERYSHERSFQRLGFSFEL
jgi:cellulose synthase/poly-beta-1,6-N-acetylglucosamine synthase-like glycosyltransferase